jgi:hypothetical protein
LPSNASDSPIFTSLKYLLINSIIVDAKKATKG